MDGTKTIEVRLTDISSLTFLDSNCVFDVERLPISNHTDCPKQVSIKDETTKLPIYKTVEHFAKKWNLGKWQSEFLDAYKIMVTNKNTGLTPITADFNSHGCKYIPSNVLKLF